MCTQEVETEQASVRVQEVDETDCPKMSSGLNDLPTWMDRDSGRKSLVRKTQRSITQAHLFCLKAQVSTKYYDACYKDAHKAATMEMNNSEGKRGTGLLAVISRINEEMLSSPNDKKLTKSSVHHAVSRGQFSVSPVKNGRPSKVPPELTRGLACHAVMMQISGKGEASSLKMRAIAGAVTLGTLHKNKFSTDYL